MVGKSLSKAFSMMPLTYKKLSELRYPRFVILGSLPLNDEKSSIESDTTPARTLDPKASNIWSIDYEMGMMRSITGLISKAMRKIPLI